MRLVSGAMDGRSPQPLWSLVPATGRARYLRRAATAILDELDPLADALADTVGQPRTEGVLAELLPSVGGLHDLADDGPRALRDKRLGRIPVLRAGRRSLLQSAPVGVVGVRGGRASPWAEPVLETGAALLAGNAVVLSTPLGERIRAAFERGGVPPELIAVVAPDEDLERARRPHRRHAPAGVQGHDGRARRRAARAHGHRRAVGRVRRRRAPPRRGRPARGRAVGRRPAARRRSWPAPSACTPATRAAATPRSARCARPRPARGSRSSWPRRSPRARRCVCGGPLDVPGVDGAFYAPAVLRGVKPGARILREPVPGPVLAVVEAADEDEAIALAKRAPAVSVWAGDRARGERVARELEADVAWVNEHGHSIPDAAVRLAGHVESRRIASQPTRLRSARWLPYDPQLVRAATASARLMHGRETERLRVLRTGALPLARTAVRLAREALGR